MGVVVSNYFPNPQNYEVRKLRGVSKTGSNGEEISDGVRSLRPTPKFLTVERTGTTQNTSVVTAPHEREERNMGQMENSRRVGIGSLDKSHGKASWGPR